MAVEAIAKRVLTAISRPRIVIAFPATVDAHLGCLSIMIIALCVHILRLVKSVLADAREPCVLLQATLEYYCFWSATINLRPFASLFYAQETRFWHA